MENIFVYGVLTQACTNARLTTTTFNYHYHTDHSQSS